LFEVGSLYSGQILSLTKLMGELQDAGNSTTLSHYLRLLSDSGLLGGLEKYAGSVIRQRSSHPKFQVHNNALLNAQGTLHFDGAITTPKYWGRLVESAVGAHLINHAATEDFRIYYWRDGGREVDFVLEHKGALVGLEVKSGYSEKASGMSTFAKQFNPQKMLLVGASGIPLADFLQINPLELFDN